LADLSQTAAEGVPRILEKLGGFRPNSQLADFRKTWQIQAKLAVGVFWKTVAEPNLQWRV